MFRHVRNLKRIEYGPFKADKATDLSDLLDLSIENLISNILILKLTPGLKILECNSDEVRYLENGGSTKYAVAFDFKKARKSLYS